MQGHRATYLCAVMREYGVVERLVELLQHPDALIQRMCLMVLGNLATAEVDPQGAAASR